MKTILFIDDSKGFSDSCRQSLEDAGYRMLVVHDNRGLLARIQRERPDLVILGSCQPRRGTVDAMDELRAEWPDVPVLLVAYCDELGAISYRRRRAPPLDRKMGDLARLERIIVESWRKAVCESVLYRRIAKIAQRRIPDAGV